MSKELTEQWRNGTLPLGAYYVNYQYNNRVWLYQDKSQTPDNTAGLFEVLAKVPTYAEFKDLMSNLQYIDKCRELTEKADHFSQMEKKVHILNEANMKLENIIGNFAKQLSEANAIIKSLKDARSQSVNEYIEKWGVK